LKKKASASKVTLFFAVRGVIPVIPRTLSHYRIIEKIGSGGMSEVYSAIDTVLGRKVALKLLSEEGLPEERAQKRFLREARAAAKLDHPNICSVYEVGQTDDICFLAMQYIEGETLVSKLRKERLELEDAIDIAAQIADALSEAHSKGIVHRDIKPQNIMIDVRQQVKVLDFGLAKLMQEALSVRSDEKTQSLLTGPGTIVGTLTYLSPEQARAEDIDGRSDIFSLGVVIYEMLSGRHPFKAASSAATISMILNHEPLPLARYLPHIPDELQRIVNKTLNKDRERRYQTVKELSIDLMSLKEELAFEARLERSTPTELKSGMAAGGSGISTDRRGLSLLHAKKDTSVASASTYAIRAYSKPLAIIALIVILAGSGAIYLYYSNLADSVAVLPFSIISSDGSSVADPDGEYLSDGLTESLINSLSRFRKLKVIARSSVFHYKGKDVDPQQVGRELGVRTVLTGRIFRRGDNITIGAELSDVRGNSQIWGIQYERRISDLLSLQKEIVTNIIENLRLHLTGEDESRLATDYTKNEEAYQLYLKGRYYWNKRTEDGFNKSISFFNQAKERDPRFALAYTGLADSYMLLSDWGFLPPVEGYAKARDAVQQALSIDDKLAEAYTSLAGIKVVLNWDWAGAENDYRRAIELNPNYPTAHHWYAGHLITMGRANECFSEMRLAKQLDPLSLGINKDLAVFLIYARRFDEALEQCRKTLEIDPNFVVMSSYIAQIYEFKQMYTEALDELQSAHAQVPDDSVISYGLAQTYAAVGRKNEATSLLEGLVNPSKEVVPKELAVLYVRLRDNDKAFGVLQDAYEKHYFVVAELRADPRFDELRSDPRYKELIRLIGLP
jgi:eukaryotic-like serine/threonine-protein kinase